MKTILFTLETPAGTFWIRPEPGDRVRLGIDHTPLRTYSSARAAAMAVGRKDTGAKAWDEDEATVPPRQLPGWKRGPELRQRALRKRAGYGGNAVREESQDQE